MADCCGGVPGQTEEAQAQRQRSVLYAVLAINVVMFAVEATAGYLAGSLALMGDSLDMLGDSLAYGTTLYAVGKTDVAKAKSARFKAWLMLIPAVVILAHGVWRIFEPRIPEASLMTGIGLLVLAANLVCLYLLTRHKDDDVNFRSVWVCSRNDIVANTSVLAAAGLVVWTGSPWPDLAVGVGIAFLFLKSSLGVFRDADAILRGEGEADVSQGACS